MNDPFEEVHSQRLGQHSAVCQYTLTGPKTPKRSSGFLQNQTPSRDPFESIHSPHHLRVLINESEFAKKSVQRELASALSEIKIRDDQITKLRGEVESLHKRIGQQEVTIKNQSKTIQDPRSLRARRAMAGTLAVQTTATQSWVTPPQTARPNVSGQQLSSLLPINVVQASKAQLGLPHAHPETQQNFGATYHVSYVPSATSPSHGQRGLDDTFAGARLQRLFDPMLDSDTRTIASQEGLQQRTLTAAGELDLSTAYGASLYAGIEFETKAAEFGGRFRTLWAEADQFAKSYGMFSKEVHPLQLSTSLKDHMMIDSNIDVAMRYLNNSEIRHLYVAKVINFYLCKKMLKYTEIVRGFDQGIDGEIINAKRKITHDAPNKVRHMLLTKIAEQVASVRQKPNFKSLCLQSRENHAYQLRTLLGPLLSSSGTSFSAFESLSEIVMSAQEIGLDLYCCPYDARFHFPEIAEAYDPTVMVNMDASFGMNLVNAKVKMSITPHIRIGLNQYDPARVRNVCNAKVFTSLPGSEESSLSRTPGRLY